MKKLRTLTSLLASGIVAMRGNIMKDEDEKQAVLDWLREVTGRTNIKGLFRDLKIDNASFYSGRYSLDRMLDVKKELQKRLKELSKM